MSDEHEVKDVAPPPMRSSSASAPETPETASAVERPRGAFPVSALFRVLGTLVLILMLFPNVMDFLVGIEVAALGRGLYAWYSEGSAFWVGWLPLFTFGLGFLTRGFFSTVARALRRLQPYVAEDASSPEV